MRVRLVTIGSLFSFAALAVGAACSQPIDATHAGGDTQGDAEAAASDASTVDDGGAAPDGARLDGGPLDAARPDVQGDTGPTPHVDAGAGASLWASPTLPALDDATVLHIRQVHALGQQKGRLDNVFMKVGDSITGSIYYLYDIGRGMSTLGELESPLRPLVNTYLATMLVDGSNPFDRDSNCAQGGMTTADALGPTNWIQMEVDDIHPAYALMMYGTDDLEIMSAATFETNLGRVVDLIEAQGVVLAISTIPARPGLANGVQIVTDFNDAVRRTAASRHLPLMDLHAGLDPLPSQGIGEDTVHLTAELDGDGGSLSGDMTMAGRAYGYNFRNLMTIELFDRLRALTR